MNLYDHLNPSQVIRRVIIHTSLSRTEVNPSEAK